MEKKRKNKNSARQIRKWPGYAHESRSWGAILRFCRFDTAYTRRKSWHTFPWTLQTICSVNNFVRSIILDTSLYRFTQQSGQHKDTKISDAMHTIIHSSKQSTTFTVGVYNVQLDATHSGKNYLLLPSRALPHYKQSHSQIHWSPETTPAFPYPILLLQRELVSFSLWTIRNG